jgi:phytoene dehydrogenase-like protein
MNEHFDVVVLGGQPAGLMAACLFARAGKRVLVAEHGEAEGGYLRHGYWYPLEPQWVAVPASGEWASFSRELKAVQPLASASGGGARQPLFQVAWADQRMDFWLDYAHDPRELQRLFGAGAAAVAAWCEAARNSAHAMRELLLARGVDLLPQGWWPRRSLAHWADAMANKVRSTVDRSATDHLDPRWHAFVTGAQRLHLPTGGDAAAVATCPGAACARGDVISEPSAIIDGCGGLSGALLARCRELGVQIVSTPVTSIAVEGARVSCATFEEPRHAVTADVFLLSAYARSAHAWFSDGKRTRRLAEEEERCEPTHVVWVEHVLARSESVPEGMARRVYAQVEGERHAGVGDFLWIEWEHPRRGDLTAASEARVERDASVVLYTVRGLVNWRDIQRPDRAAQVHALFHSHLQRLVPFVERHQIDKASALESEGWNAASRPPRLEPRWHYPLFPLAAAGVLPVFGLPLRTAFSNMLRCGFEVLPGFGLDGAIYCARRTVEHCTATMWR